MFLRSIQTSTFTPSCFTSHLLDKRIVRSVGGGERTVRRAVPVPPSGLFSHWGRDSPCGREKSTGQKVLVRSNCTTYNVVRYAVGRLHKAFHACVSGRNVTSIRVVHYVRGAVVHVHGAFENPVLVRLEFLCGDHNHALITILSWTLQAAFGA